MLRSVGLRLARRCHLTEQIGARRRDLYANDMFTPVDDNIVWEYKKSSAKADVGRYQARDYVKKPFIGTPINESIPEESNVKVPISFHEPVEAPIRFDENRQSRACLERKMEVLLAQVISLCDKPESDLFEQIRLEADEIHSISKIAPSIDLEPGRFLEDYLCLYHRCEIDRSSRRLSSSASPLPASLVKSLVHYHECLVAPTVTELLELRDAITRVDFAKVSKTMLPDLTRMYIFLHHPLIESFIRSRPEPDQEASKEKLKFPTKNEIKNLRELLPERFEFLIPDALKHKQISIPLAYRASLVVSGDTTKDPSMEFLRKASMTFKAETAFLHSINTHFKSSLFSR